MVKAAALCNDPGALGSAPPPHPGFCKHPRQSPGPSPAHPAPAWASLSVPPYFHHLEPVASSRPAQSRPHPHPASVLPFSAGAFPQGVPAWLKTRPCPVPCTQRCEMGTSWRGTCLSLNTGPTSYEKPWLKDSGGGEPGVRWGLVREQSARAFLFAPDSQPAPGSSASGPPVWPRNRTRGVGRAFPVPRRTRAVGDLVPDSCTRGGGRTPQGLQSVGTDRAAERAPGSWEQPRPRHARAHERC